MPASKAQQRAVSKYMKENYDVYQIRMPKGRKAEIQAHAEPQEAPAVQDTTQAKERTEGVPLHTLEQRIRKKLYKHGGTIKKSRKSGGYTVVYEDTTLDFPDYAALLEYADKL